MRWLKQNWMFLAVSLFITVAIVLFVVYRVYRADTNRLVPLLSLFSFIVTAFLVIITAEYVRTNQITLKLLETQWKAKNEVEVKFGLRARHDAAQVWVLNYGLANVVLTKILVTLGGEQTSKTIYKNMVLRPGEKKFFHLPHRKWGKLEIAQNIQVTLFCESTTQQFEQAKVYTLFLTERSQVYKIMKGLHGLWPVGCTKYNKFKGICMVTDGLKNFDDANQREKEMQAEVAASCPRHASKWILTMEHVTKPGMEGSGE